MKMKREEYVISKEMQEKIDKISDHRTGTKRIFTKEEDAVILKYYKIKNKVELAKLIGVHRNTLQYRYKELTENEQN